MEKYLWMEGVKETYSIITQLCVNVIDSECKCSTCNEPSGLGTRYISFLVTILPDKKVLYNTVQCGEHNYDDEFLLPINDKEDLLQVQTIVGEAFSKARGIKELVANIEKRRNDFLKLVRKGVGGCFYCRKLGAKLYCGGCNLMMYCSPECQRADWADSHRSICKIANGLKMVKILQIKK